MIKEAMVLAGILIGAISALVGACGFFYIETKVREHHVYVPTMKYPSDLLKVSHAYKELAEQNRYSLVSVWLFYCGFFGILLSAALVVIGSLAAATKN